MPDYRPDIQVAIIQNGTLIPITEWDPYRQYILPSELENRLTLLKIELGSPGPGSGGSVLSVNGMTGDVVLTKSHLGLGNADNTSDENKPLSTIQAQEIAASRNRANQTGTQTASTISDFATAVSDAQASALTAARARANHTGTQTASTISDFTAAVQAIVGTTTPGTGTTTGTGAVDSVNGLTGTVSLGLGSLEDVQLAITTFNDDGTVLTPGVQDYEFLGWDEENNRWRNLGIDPSKLAIDPRYAASDYLPKFFVPQVVLQTSADTVPVDFPTYGLIHDLTQPELGLYESVNTVAASGISRSLAALTDATINDITLTANCTLGFPGAVAGAHVALLLRQDTTGGRTVVWPSSITWPGTTSPGTAPTLLSSAGSSDLFYFESYSGSGWRMVNHVQYAAPVVVVKTAPTVRGTFNGSTGTLNGVNTASATVPAGIAANDIGYVLVYVASATPATITFPTNWAVVDGPQSQTALSTWLLRRNMVAADSGTTFTVTSTTTDAVTGATVAANDRIGIVGIVVTGGTTSGEVRVAHADASVDINLEIPAIIPSADASLLVDLAGIRFNSSTAPSVTPTTGWTERVDVNEGRTAAAQYGLFIQTKALTGNGGLEQAAVTATHSVNAADMGWLIAIPPA